jgi:hypothetical protein
MTTEEVEQPEKDIRTKYREFKARQKKDWKEKNSDWQFQWIAYQDIPIGQSRWYWRVGTYRDTYGRTIVKVTKMRGENQSVGTINFSNAVEAQKVFEAVLAMLNGHN